MLELFEKIDILKQRLNCDERIQQLEKVQLEIVGDSLLYQNIREKKKCAFDSEKVKKYKICENEVNFLILEMRSYLKENLKEKEDCLDEDH